jgi:hypothetical protein
MSTPYSIQTIKHTPRSSLFSLVFYGGCAIVIARNTDELFPSDTTMAKRQINAASQDVKSMQAHISRAESLVRKESEAVAAVRKQFDLFRKSLDG